MKCRVCKSNNNKFIFFVINYLEKFNQKFPYNICNNCGSFFLNKNLKNISKFYPKNYAPYLKENESIIHTQTVINIIQTITKKKTVFEVGPGQGHLIKTLKKQSYNCNAIELDKSISSSLRVSGIKIFNTELEKMNLKKLNTKADIVIACHSLEHLQNLDIFLNFCKKMCKKNGYVYISVPNIESFSSKIFKELWYHLEAPRHLLLPREKTLDNIFEKNNFKKVFSSKRDYSAIHFSKFGWSASGYYLYKKRKNKLYSYLGKFLSYFMPYVEAIFNRTSQITSVYKNKN